MKQLSLLEPLSHSLPTIPEKSTNKLETEPIYRVDYDNLEDLTIKVKHIYPNWQTSCSCSDGVRRNFDFRKLIEIPHTLTISLPKTNHVLGVKPGIGVAESSLLLQSSPETRLAKHLFDNKTDIGVAGSSLLLQSKKRAAELIIERDRLLNEGTIAPEDCWLVTGRVTKTFVKCWYKSREPIFNGYKSRYIGREDSPAAKEARAAIARRNRLRAIAKELKLLETRNENNN